MNGNTFMTELATTLAAPLAPFCAQDRPLAYVGFDVPLDVLLASGRPFCHLPWQKQRATPHADRWLETSFPGWARSLVEDWLAGAFDVFERVIFTRGDDASQRLYYYLCELQRRGIAGGPLPCIFDVAMIPRATSIVHCERALHSLMNDLGIDTAMLLDGITQANRQREWFARLDSERCAAGHLYENIARATLFGDSALTATVIELAPVTGRRLLLTGSVPPDDMFHRAAESCGWNVVHEVHQLTLSRHGAPLLVAADDPVTLLAQHCNTRRSGARVFADRAAALINAGQRVAADAIVLWVTEEDEALTWDVARQRAALAAAGLPHLVLTRRRWDGNDGAADQICRFLQELAV
jgi:hypothetical protein